MPKVRTILDNGGAGRSGVTNVHSYNVYPTTLVAGASGSPLIMDVALFNKYDFFHVEQVGGATDEIALPDDAPIGTRFSLYIDEVVIIQSETDASEINGVASKGYTCTALDFIHCTKITSTAWIMHKILEVDGAVTSIVPGT